MSERGKRIRIAQLGVGYWGPNWLRNLVANRGCEVRCVVDRAAERLELVRDLYPRLATARELEPVLADPEVDAVVIATPVGTHFDLALRSLEAGKHCLVEKPLATTRAEVDALAHVAAEAGLVLMVGHTFLYNPAVHALRDVVRDPEFGELRYVYAQRLNLGRIRSDVDVLWNLAPHDVSILQYLLDDAEPLEVRARGMDYIQPGIDDVAFLELVYPNKVMAHVHVSWLDPHKTRRLTAVGSRRMVVYDDAAEHKLAIYDKGIDQVAALGEEMVFDRPVPPAFTHRSGDVWLPKLPATEPLAAELEHFLDCVRDGRPCRTGPAHARSVVDILERAQRAR